MSDNEQQSPIHENPQSPSVLGGLLGNGSHENDQSTATDATRGLKRTRHEDDDDDDEKPRPDRRKIEIKFIQDKSRRHITFSKRKAGIMKKVILSDGFKYEAMLTHQGIRIVSPHWNPSTTSGGFGDRACLHLHNPKAAAFGHQGGRKESYSGAAHNYVLWRIC